MVASVVFVAVLGGRGFIYAQICAQLINFRFWNFSHVSSTRCDTRTVSNCVYSAFSHPECHKRNEKRGQQLSANIKQGQTKSNKTCGFEFSDSLAAVTSVCPSLPVCLLRLSSRQEMAAALSTVCGFRTSGGTVPEAQTQLVSA